MRADFSIRSVASLMRKLCAQALFNECSANEIGYVQQHFICSEGAMETRPAKNLEGIYESTAKCRTSLRIGKKQCTSLEYLKCEMT